MKILINHLSLILGVPLSASRMNSLRLCVSVLKVILIVLTISSLTYSQSLINFQSGTNIDVQSGASVCADSVILSGTFTGGGSICGLLFSLNLNAILEGFYDASTDIMVSDTATVYLRSSVSPYAIVDSDKKILNSSGAGVFSFANAVNGTSYYIVVTHRNSIETWSGATSMFSGGTLSYNFVSAAAQAYGNNMKQVDASPVKYGIYSGDVNQDGYVDLTDVTLVFNDAGSFSAGYIVTDLNGDNIVDLTDLTIAFNNSSSFVSVIRP